MPDITNEDLYEVLAEIRDPLRDIHAKLGAEPDHHTPSRDW